MQTIRPFFVLTAAAVLSASVAFAQGNNGAKADTTPATNDSTAAPAKKKTISTFPEIEIQHVRPTDQRGLNTFEWPKTDPVPFNGFKLSFGAAFAQQFQGLDHRNSAKANVVSGVNANQLIRMGHGFNNAAANLYVNAQLAPGIRVALTSYLSSKHHNETWVKDGYLLVDESPINWQPLNTLFKYVTIRAGHFEINYGDAHFRRSDNGNAMFNPFVGNLVLDAFTTEVGGEVYLRAKSFIAMAGMTGGEIKGNILTPQNRDPAYIGKLGFDKQFNKDVRVRLTGSTYRINKSAAGTLYAGDRAGSRYNYVMENTAAAATIPTSGLINPGFGRRVTSYMINPFVKVKGLELFGVAEQAKGATNAAETTTRTFKQYDADVIYRFLPGEKVFVGGRYNTVKGRLAAMTNDISVDHSALSAGWFMTGNVLLKGEWVNQKYNDFPLTDIRNGGKFKGFVVEGVVAF